MCDPSPICSIAATQFKKYEHHMTQRNGMRTYLARATY